MQVDDSSSDESVGLPSVTRTSAPSSNTPTPTPILNDDDNDDDPIMYEIPVHFNSELASSLHMLQFPLRPSYRPMSKAPVAARFKPKNHMLQLDYPADQNLDYYDHEAEPYLKQPVITLEAPDAVPALTNYACGVFRQGALHLTPLKGIYQLRPSFQHIDQAVEDDDIAMEAFLEDEEMAGSNSEEEHKEGEAMHVAVQIKAKTSERAQSILEHSYGYKRTLQNMEKWVPLRINTCVEDDDFDECFEKLFNTCDEDVGEFYTAQEYLAKLKNHSGKAVTALPSSASASPLHTNASTTPPTALEKKLFHLLRTEKLVTLTTLKHICGLHSDVEALALLTTYTRVVQGAFMLKGALYLNAAEAALLERVIYTISIDPLHLQGEGISRVMLAEYLSADAVKIKTILTAFATFDPSARTWRLKCMDSSLWTQFPTFCQDMLSQWCEDLM